MAEQIEFLLTNIQSFSIFTNYLVMLFMILLPLFPPFRLPFRSLITEQSKTVLFDLLNGRNNVRYISTTIAHGAVHLRGEVQQSALG